MKSILLSSLLTVMLAGTAFSEEPEKADAPPVQGVEQPGILERFFATDPLVSRNRDRAKVNLAGFYDFKSGNTNTFSANGLFSFIYNDGKTEFSSTYKRFYTETNRRQNENNGDGILRFDRFAFRRVEFFVFTEFVDDRRLKLKLRSSTGAGAKLVLMRNKYWLFDASCAPLYQVEIYTPYRYNSKDYSLVPKLTMEQTYDYYKKHRESYPMHQVRFSYRVRISLTPFGEPFEIRSALFYVPYYKNYSMYRILWDSYLRLRFLKDACDRWGFFLHCGYQKKYNTTVQPGARKFDDRIYGRLEWEQKFL